ncbi:MAG: radical SAM family heme chaperone HemW [Bacteroidales bacterium]
MLEIRLMAGIYIHIPFCKQICHYCDFYKTANLKLINDFIQILIVEIKQRNNYLDSEISTIYFGGGTPSVIGVNNLSLIVKELYLNFNISNNVEFTVEVNPDDVSVLFINELKNIGVNRLSFGIQSFENNILKFLNRRHDADTARKAIQISKNAGIENISCDLIYGIPNQTIEDFRFDLGEILKYDIVHLSAYHLGIEENTYFGKLHKKGRFKEVDEKESLTFYNELIFWAQKYNYEHYEVSNFARNKVYSKHNTSYWNDIPYIGLGPSAHSYNGKSRQFNVSNLSEYLKKLSSGEVFFSREILTEKDRFNEYILTRLRTKWGVDFKEIENNFNVHYVLHVKRTVSKLDKTGYIRIDFSKVSLTEEGFFVSDYVIREFMIV